MESAVSKRGMGLQGEREKVASCAGVEQDGPTVVQCYKYSRSRAWWRAMRSEWLEILQKGMLCCGRKKKIHL